MRKLVAALFVVIGLGAAVVVITLSLSSTNVVEACISNAC
jgi:hypothetical protein